MSTVTGASNTEPVNYEDVAALRSRISWGAVVAGSVFALALYIVLGLFLTAVGLSIADANPNTDQGLGTGAAVAVAVCMALALFAGGCATTQLTAGETTHEAVLHGILTWATVTTLSLLMAGMVARAGASAITGAAAMSGSLARNTNASWEEMARAAGVPQDRIDQAKRGLTPQDARQASEAVRDPANQEAARQAAAKGAWYTLTGTLLAMGAAVGGALFGAGPRFRLIPVPVRRAAPGAAGGPGNLGMAH